MKIIIFLPDDGCQIFSEDRPRSAGMGFPLPVALRAAPAIQKGVEIGPADGLKEV
jgi:hypothetical protein